MKTLPANTPEIPALAFRHPELVEGSVPRGGQPSSGKLISRRQPASGSSAHAGSRRLLVLAFLVCLLPVGFSLRAQTDPNDRVGPLARVTLHLGKASLTTEIAASGAQQERGLMYRSTLPDDNGMIFLLPKVTTATFWMKNTLIPLSIAFLDKNGVILEIHDMKAMDQTVTRSDSDKVAYALEANLHWFALNGVKPGDKIDPAPATLGPSSP